MVYDKVLELAPENEKAKAKKAETEEKFSNLNK